MEWIDNKSILSDASGFLANGFTHTLSPYSGCSFAGTLCGQYCYAQKIWYVAKGRDWGLYGAKKNVVEAYIKQYRSIRLSKKGSKPLRIFMSSVTDPYVPQEKKLQITRRLLETMLLHPPDKLVLQTRNPLVLRDLDLLKQLSAKCNLWMSMTIETDMVQIEGLPRHSFTPEQRFTAARTLKQAGIPIQITVSPLLPIEDLKRFTHDLDRSCHRVILDHYSLGDGSNGKRTERLGFPRTLIDNGYEEWTTLEKFYAVFDCVKGILGENRTLLSEEGFNQD